MWRYGKSKVFHKLFTVSISYYNTATLIGNVLVNVGPTREGTIPPIMEERLLQMGYWLDINGEAIYQSVPWIHQNDTVTSGVW